MVWNVYFERCFTYIYCFAHVKETMQDTLFSSLVVPMEESTMSIT